MTWMLKLATVGNCLTGKRHFHASIDSLLCCVLCHRWLYYFLQWFLVKILKSGSKRWLICKALSPAYLLPSFCFLMKFHSCQCDSLGFFLPSLLPCWIMQINLSIDKLDIWKYYAHKDKPRRNKHFFFFFSFFPVPSSGRKFSPFWFYTIYMIFFWSKNPLSFFSVFLCYSWERWRGKESFG